MVDEQNTILDDLLSRWHAWSAGYSLSSSPSTSPMFRQAKSSRSWDSSTEIVHDEVESSTMEKVDFVVCEMQEPHRSAIYAHARNLCTGQKVWSSPRLPLCPQERSIVLMEAVNKLSWVLHDEGVI